MEPTTKLILGLLALVLVLAIGYGIVQLCARRSDAETDVETQGGGGPNPKLPPT